MSILDDSRLQRFFQEHSDHADRSDRLAVFDCDGTVIRGDIGEAMLAHQVEHFLFKVSPADVWQDHPDRPRLDRLYQSLARASARERTTHPDFGEFFSLIFGWYFGQIDEGKIEKACVDIVRLFTGFTPDEVRQVADDSFATQFSSPCSETPFGNHGIARGARYIQESRQMIEELQHRGYEIWAVSGSNIWSVEPVFRQLGIPPARVIGIELDTESGLLVPRGIEPVPIREKKVDALQSRTNTRPLLVASDSRNDIPLLEYSADLKVFVNSRRKDWTVFFDLGNITRDDSWIVVETPTIEE
jgi:phosphoserine phosphatase